MKIVLYSNGPVNTNKNKMQKLLQKLKKINLSFDQYAIYGSGPLAIRGLRKTKDLDIIVKNSLYKKLLKKYSEAKPGHIKVGALEIYADWNSLLDNPQKVIERAETIQGFKFIRLEDSIKWKKKMGREKDLKDIKLIEEYLKSKK